MHAKYRLIGKKTEKKTRNLLKEIKVHNKISIYYGHMKEIVLN